LISFVLPTLNDERALGPALAALAPGIGAGMIREVIFADGGSTDDTPAIAEAVGARLIPGPRARDARLRAAGGAARGVWLMFLDPRLRLRADWPDAARDHLAAFPEMAGWTILRGGRWSNLRARLTARPGVAHGLLLPAALYARTGGHAPARDPEADLARRIGRARLRPTAMIASIGPSG
jgi:glycosyltransferase involved in cell wall biosynthesis